MKTLYKNYFNIIEKYRNNKLLLLFYISLFVITAIYVSVNAKLIRKQSASGQRKKQLTIY